MCCIRKQLELLLGTGAKRSHIFAISNAKIDELGEEVLSILRK